MLKAVLLSIVLGLASCSFAEISANTETASDKQTAFSNQHQESQEVFPALPEEEGGVVNVRDYGAKGDGISDDTEAFRKALSRDEIANSSKIVYVPSGTYLVSDTIEWPKGSHSGLYYKRTTLLGENKQNTVIKLKDNTPSFSQAGKPIIDTKHNRANGFRNRVENLTIDTGSGNPGAVGVYFNSNNGGGIFNVSIVSGDGQGSSGIDLTGAELGPLLIKNVAVTGFDVGIEVSGGKTNSVTMENIALEQQNQLGIDQAMQVLTIRNLRSINRVPVIRVRAHSATLALHGAELEGIDSSSVTAIETQYREDGSGTSGEKSTIATFFSRIEQQGYQNTAKVYSCETGERQTLAGNIEEWTCQAPLTGFSTQTKTLRLPVQETPNLEHDLNNIAVVEGYTAADIQAAIDTPGVKTVFLPNGTYQVDEPVLIRGSVEKLIGMRARFSDNPLFRLEDGEAPVVELERIEGISIEHNSDRTLAIQHAAINSYTNTEAGTGDVFFEDVVSGLITLQNQKAWARSLNVETTPPDAGAKIVNNGGSLWILGLKTEDPGTIIKTTNNGSTEVLGGLIYINSDIPDSPPQAQYISDRSQVSILTRSYNPAAIGYQVLVREIKEGTKELTDGAVFPYIGY